MNYLTKTATVAFSAVAIGLVIAGCQSQGGPAATDEAPVAAEATTAAADAAADAMPPNVLTAAEQIELLTGNTLMGALDSFKLTWAEYFAPDGTTKALLRFEGEDDLEITGTYFADDQDRFCTEYPEMEQKFGQTVFCNKIVSLGDGRYQQLWEDGTRGAVYEQILEGDQIDTFR